MNTRDMLVIVWQFNGEFALCNYKCPYCYYDQDSGVLQNRDFNGPIEKWHTAFKSVFPNRKIIFYLSFGEPTISKDFNEIMDMIADEPNWILHITSNLSLPISSLEKIVNHKLIKERRFFINASFHPTQTTIKKFSEKLMFLREHLIECPVIIVMWPPILENFNSYFNKFNENKFLIHVRRFCGWYNRKYYPRAYTEEERQFISRYADDATIKYMLNDHFGNLAKDKLSYIGIDYILVDKDGNVWESPDYKGRCLGNIFKKVKLNDGPKAYSGGIYGSVNAVASLVELKYPQLKPNMVTSFAQHGGVYHTKNGIYYKNMSTNFYNPTIRTHYNFPNRKNKKIINFFTNIVDKIYMHTYFQRKHFPFYLITPLLGRYYNIPPSRIKPEELEPKLYTNIKRLLKQITS